MFKLLGMISSLIGIYAVIHVIIGFIVAYVTTCAGGEKFILDKNTIKFILMGPFLFLKK